MHTEETAGESADRQYAIQHLARPLLRAQTDGVFRLD